ncbi:PREDICTED: PHD finger protein ALFIN-LIKE 2-like [Nicotiana attenuata]|uniref:PHD finger protein ALFIN-LIKE n=1 Tax=Nicotiana attenuata TaxID=49451 RepID=A0A1J6HZ58_NICAT|nr:PREDICTED: PHD finger protein ALFIN-LIKE 2-like [Nicotiana attenuata]OIS98100.1 phd finger protein alfin-like 2 [Nicotiana attenuata]
MSSISSSPRTVEEIFKDYNARRTGIVRALSYDVDEFYNLCDPEKENLCLYGHPNETWEVNLPAEEVPPELPEPALGINFARDGMTRRDWLSLVAVHSDCWLLSVAFFFGARLNQNERYSSKIQVLSSLFLLSSCDLPDLHQLSLHCNLN